MAPISRSWLHSNGGSASVEFVAIFLFFISIIFFVIEVTLYMFFLASMEKAAQAGVRAAAVSLPVVGVPSVNAPGGAQLGEACDLEGNCSTFSASCDGNCSGNSFDRILDHMQGFNGRIGAENVSIRYEYAGIGFAGGPTTPMITVTVSCVPFQTGILGLVVVNVDSMLNPDDDACSGPSLPPRSASMTGEDLAP